MQRTMEQLKVLIVEDNQEVLLEIKHVLLNFKMTHPYLDEAVSFSIKDTNAVSKALDIVSKENIDIVLIDRSLPGMRDVEAFNTVKKLSHKSGVMVLTSNDAIETTIKTIYHGAYNFLLKPFTPDELKLSMENISNHLLSLRMAHKMKEESCYIKYHVLPVLSHELKSPLSAVEGYLEMLKEKQAGESIINGMNMIDRSILRIRSMRELVNDMLELTRLEMGKEVRNLRKVKLKEITNKAVETMMPLAISRNIEISTNVDDDAIITADPCEMEIIFNNLLSNAIKYNRKNGKVNVSAKRIGDYVQIFISDTGIGIDREDFPKLFTPFSRIKKQETQMISGSGLGLSIAKKLIDLYHGEINVRSKPEQGTTFEIILPALKLSTCEAMIG